jgi:transposase
MPYSGPPMGGLLEGVAMSEQPRAPRAGVGPVRLRRANRAQVVLVPAYLDTLLPEDHLARLVWAAVERLDWSAFTAELVVVEGGPGRAAADPQVLGALWLYATSQGVTSARALARLCVEHLAYLWLGGGVSLNYHTLSDFRTAHGAALDQLMTEVLGCLRHAGLVEFAQVAQDGMRVRASAGAASFRRGPTLEQALGEAQAFLAQVQEAGAPPDGDPDGPPTPRQRAARERAARARVARVAAALAALPAAQAAKPPKQQGQARVSTTDAEARVMKMADGGFRPAYNVEFAADTAHRAIVGVAVTNVGSDLAQAPPMVAQVRERMGRLPGYWLVDGGFASHATIEAVAAQGVAVLAPVPYPKELTRDRFTPRASDSAVIAAWRARMGTAPAQALYGLRGQTSECVNAHARYHGLEQLRVRGLAKVQCVALWMALTHNLLLWVRRRPVGPPAARAVA